MQGFHQRHIFGDVVILVANPFGDADGAAFAAVDDYSNTRWPRITQGTTVHVGHEFRHHCFVSTNSKMRRERFCVKTNIWRELKIFAISCKSGAVNFCVKKPVPN